MAKRSRRPRSWWTSISRPARNSRNARPNRARICTGRSTRTQPNPEGPMMIPPTISRTTAGMRSRGAKPTVSGARTATAATTSRLTNDTSGMSGHQRLCRRLAGGAEPAGDVVGDTEGVGDDGQCRVDRRAGHEEARVHGVEAQAAAEVVVAGQHVLAALDGVQQALELPPEPAVCLGVGLDVPQLDP